MDFKIKTLTSDTLDDFLYFFDSVAFSDNPEWATCYCHFYHFQGTNEQFFRRTAKENREASKALILSGKMNGFIAYFDNKPIGWCNINSKDNYAKIPYERKNKVKIASIICFVVAPAYRKQGIAKQLLNFACSNSIYRGYDLIEAYPRKGENLSDAHSYRGPISLYISEGFSIYKEFKDYYVVHKKT
ncbi:MAG: GNAT family N-acetyltransferase [Promethearchaeota archaeon]|nr:MAG: GNAT family N-acetyltransferase [Candidatus Lokiarchaeota archaeon]